ncbi:MAG: ParB N-terminal domain-containing protein [Acidobacteriales bacterium]|nr:ParB N-terminal domain-containing protein [Terriglobales bacterium]
MSEMDQQPDTQPMLQYVSPDMLEFDPDNPRFAGQLADKSQDEIQEYIFGEPHYASELVDSFLENGYIDYEPLVVRRKRNKFVVVEGNRRFAAIREIRSHPDKYEGQKSDLENIPVLVFTDRPGQRQQNEMRIYLGVRHLLGFREWPPISKALFLERESKTPGGLDRVIKETRLTKAQVRRFLIPYRLLQRAGVTLPKGEDFWVLGEALQRAGVKKFLQLEVDSATLDVVGYDRKNLTLLLNDLYGPKKGLERDASAKVVSDTRDLSRLSRVLDSEKASAVLHAGKSLGEAEIYVDTREQSLSRLKKVTKELGLLLKKLLPGSKDPDETKLLQFFRQFETAVKGFISKNANPSV